RATRYDEAEQRGFVRAGILRVHHVVGLVVGNAMRPNVSRDVGDELARATDYRHLGAPEVVVGGGEELVRFGVVDGGIAGAGVLNSRGYLAGLEVPDDEVLRLGSAAAVQQGNVEGRIDRIAVGVALVHDVELFDHRVLGHVELVHHVVPGPGEVHEFVRRVVARLLDAPARSVDLLFDRVLVHVDDGYELVVA